MVILWQSQSPRHGQSSESTPTVSQIQIWSAMYGILCIYDGWITRTCSRLAYFRCSLCWAAVDITVLKRKRGRSVGMCDFSQRRYPWASCLSCFLLLLILRCCSIICLCHCTTAPLVLHTHCIVKRKWIPGSWDARQTRNILPQLPRGSLAQHTHVWNCKANTVLLKPHAMCKLCTVQRACHCCIKLAIHSQVTFRISCIIEWLWVHNCI